MSDELARNALIGEIHGLLEKLGKPRHWLLEQLVLLDPSLQFSNEMTRHDMLKSCSTELLERVNDRLNGILAGQKAVIPYAETYHWFFTDIVASSDPKVTVDDQALRIINLNNLIKSTETFRNRDVSSTMILPTGDGNAIGFKDSQEKPLLLAIELQKALSDFNLGKPEDKRLYLRIGLASGNVFMIEDLTGKLNAWGEGIILARRVMDLGLPNSILATDGFANDIRLLRDDYRRIMRLIGDYNIKHKIIPVYNVYGALDGITFGNKENPPHPEQKSEVDQQMIKSNAFFFNHIEVKLEIMDTKTMLTRHTWVREIVNLQEKPVEAVFYYLDGDVDRDFADLNVKVTDELGTELAISRLNLNEPRKKEFYVTLREMLRPKEIGRRVTLQFDWEETTRKYEYAFGSDCKKFRFLLVAPRSMPIIQRVLRIFLHTGDKEEARPLPTLKHFSDRTEVEWNASDIKAMEVYRFDW